MLLTSYGSVAAPPKANYPIILTKKHTVNANRYTKNTTYLILD